MFTLPFCHTLASPRRAEPAILAIGVAVALAGLASVIPVRNAVPPAEQPAPARSMVTLSADGTSLAALRDAAEAMRSRLLRLPGVGAVRLDGLLTTGLEVDYAPARLARLGVTEEELRAAMPAPALATSPGHIAVPLDAWRNGPQPIADRIVHAGGHLFRLGDVATVARVSIDPVSVLSHDGRPAIELMVVPAPGASAGSLDRVVAAETDGMAPPHAAPR